MTLLTAFLSVSVCPLPAAGLLEVSVRGLEEAGELDKRGVLLGQTIHDAWNPAINKCEAFPRKKYFESTLEVLTGSLHLMLSFHLVDKTITSSNLHRGW